MEVINPIMISKKKWRMKEFKTAGTSTWTVPEDVIALFLVFGGGGNPHTSYTGGAGSGHMAAAWVTLIKGETVTATIAAASTTNGASGQASSLKISNMVVSAGGGSGVIGTNGGAGGSGGGGGVLVSSDGYEYSGTAGTSSYGGGAGAGGCNYYGSPNNGGSGGTYGGGGGAGGRWFSSGAAQESTKSGGNRGQIITNSPPKQVLSIEKEVSLNTFLGIGGRSGENATPTNGTHIITENAALISLMKPILDAYFPGKSLSDCVSKGGTSNKSLPNSGGAGGAGIYSKGQDTQAAAYSNSGVSAGYGGGGGGGLIGYPEYPISINTAKGGGGGGGFFSNPTPGFGIYGGGGGGVLDKGNPFYRTSESCSFGGCIYNSSPKYGGAGIAFILY